MHDKNLVLSLQTMAPDADAGLISFWSTLSIGNCGWSTISIYCNKAIDVEIADPIDRIHP